MQLFTEKKVGLKECEIGTCLGLQPSYRGSADSIYNLLGRLDTVARTITPRMLQPIHDRAAGVNVLLSTVKGPGFSQPAPVDGAAAGDPISPEKSAGAENYPPIIGKSAGAENPPPSPVEGAGAGDPTASPVGGAVTEKQAPDAMAELLHFFRT